MKTDDIKELSADERSHKLNELKQELFNLRFQHEVGQLENNQKMKLVKRDIARINTLIRAAQLQSTTDKE